MTMNIAWFKTEFWDRLEKYNIEYSHFTNGDFGDLERIEFEGHGKLGTVDFWSLGWLNIHVIDQRTGNELQNVLFEPYQEKEKVEALNKLKHMM